MEMEPVRMEQRLGAGRSRTAEAGERGVGDLKLGGAGTGRGKAAAVGEMN